MSSEEAVMKHAPASLPDAPYGGVSAGIDWASEDHAVCIVDGAGQVVSQFCASTRPIDCRTWCNAWPWRAWLRRRSSAATAGSRSAGGRGVTVVVITPRQVRN